MKYTVDDKIIAENFLHCKIPEPIKWNEFDIKHDTMECYEALFDFAHCVLDDMIFTSIFEKSLSDDEFSQLLKCMKENKQNEEFCDSALSLLQIYKKYKNKE